MVIPIAIGIYYKNTVFSKATDELENNQLQWLYYNQIGSCQMCELFFDIPNLFKIFFKKISKTRQASTSQQESIQEYSMLTKQ